MNARAWLAFLISAALVCFDPALELGNAQDPQSLNSSDIVTTAIGTSVIAEQPAAVIAAPDHLEPGTDNCLGDQIVLVSTRNCSSSKGRTIDFHTFPGYVCKPCGHCTQQPVQLTESHHFVETWIFVHGNQIPAELAVERGTRVYRSLRSQSPNQGPIRFVIWSWPSQRDTGRLRDAKIKAARTEVETFYLGGFLAATAHQGPTKIIGYSFGARVVSGALHLNEGGTVAGYYLPNHTRPAHPYRVAFLAAAVECDALQHGGRYCRALNNVDDLLLQNNSKDQALRFFWVVKPSEKPRALGNTGLKCAPAHCRVRQFDWADIIGKDHSVWQYIDRSIILQRISETFTR